MTWLDDPIKIYDDSDEVFLTVVMSVLNEALFIGNTLRQLINQDYPEHLFEIIVADGMSTDMTRDIVRQLGQEHPQIRLVDNPGRLAGSGRNVGFVKGVGDLFIVVDGHCYIQSKNFFKDTVACFRHSGADCLCRPQPLDPPDIGGFQIAVAYARQSVIGHGRNSLIYSEHEGFVSPVSNGAVYSRKVIETVGFVNESFDACEDVEFNYRVDRAGFKSYMSPKLTVKYYPRDSIPSLFKQLKRYGTGRFKFMVKHSESISLTTWLPFLFLAFVMLNFTLGFFYPDFMAIFVVVMGVYFSVIGMVSLFICMKIGYDKFSILLPIFMTIHVALGWGVGLGLIYHLWGGVKRRYVVGGESRVG